MNISENVYLVFREGSAKLSHLSRAQLHLDIRPERPVVRAALAVTGEHEGAGDDLLSVRLGVAEMVLAVAVQDLLSFLYAVFGHQVGLSVRNL